MTKFKTLLFTAGIALAVAGCDRDAGSDAGTRHAVLVDGTGTYSRPIPTESEQAQQFFDQGLRLTWGYYFPDAAASHLEALRHDPGNPMIYWGLALATGPNPNSRYMGAPDDPQGEGKRFIAKAYELRGDLPEPERSMIGALHVRYDDDSHPERAARDQAYLDATRELHAEHPDDPDVAALYADAFMVTSPWQYWDDQGNPAPGTREVVRALEASMASAPEHPGTNHLYIHIMEASNEPERALPQADRLESLMPGAGHIVHMPTHIYVRVGDQDKAIAWNERSIAADRRFLEQWGDLPYPEFTTYPLSARLHATHAYDFIRYSASIKGDYDRALAAARSAEDVVSSRAPLSDGRAQRTVAAVWLVHRIFEQWQPILDGAGPPEAGHQYLDGMWAYVRGGALAGTGDLEGARDELRKLRSIAADPSPDRTLVMVTPPPAILRIAALDLEGEIAMAAGDPQSAIAAFEQAVNLEDEIGYMEPPDWPHPMRLALGEALLESGQPERAAAVYREDLEWNRDNPWAMSGLCAALSAAGSEEEAADVCAEAPPLAASL